MNNINILDWVKTKYNENIINKIIMINVAIFIFTSVVSMLGFDLTNLFALPMNSTEVLYKPWTILTHMFMHSGVFHILFNMVTLYFAGNMFLSYFSERKLLSLYLAGGIFAAVMLVILSSIVPVLSGGYAVGASAAIMTILIAMCAYKPNLSVGLMFIGQVKMKYVGIGLVVIDFISIPDSNAGGHVAHLSGALFGLIFAVLMNKGVDIMKIFDKQTKSQPKAKTQKSQPQYQAPRPKAQPSKEYNMNQILDKISKKGLNSLEEEERDFLKNYYK